LIRKKGTPKIGRGKAMESSRQRRQKTATKLKSARSKKGKKKKRGKKERDKAAHRVDTQGISILVSHICGNAKREKGRALLAHRGRGVFSLYVKRSCVQKKEAGSRLVKKQNRAENKEEGRPE